MRQSLFRHCDKSDGITFVTGRCCFCSGPVLQFCDNMDLLRSQHAAPNRQVARRVRQLHRKKKDRPHVSPCALLLGTLGAF